MATELLLCKVNYGWRKAGSAAGFALLESVSGPKEGKNIGSAVFGSTTR